MRRIFSLTRFISFMPTVLGIFSLAILASCSSAPEESDKTQIQQNIESSHTVSPAADSVELANEKKRIISCGSMPPIQDRSKLKSNLVKKGVITPEMSLEQADEKVAEFIRKKQQAFKNCSKFRPEGSKLL
ncbi:hypothetical protein FM037_27495 [Shewanella psychropiezotolerans]|uniref:Lipoprotein n=1 Tax=Shewanella psychropiezotolerans TaxID=2593655 RepID=A0ABX5X4X0_9GAMM|nr:MULTISPECIES: hypothetical protein [Shewanella]MPY25707.1 hypothetical protein [Shewanella sp. YLB-07]QDO86324.1 hypothetical protein FM037_27495 [Shewanella psychropiezotolerans]